MVKKTGFTGIFTKDIEERISLKDIIKEREKNEKRMKAVMEKYLAKTRRSK